MKKNFPWKPLLLGLLLGLLCGCIKIKDELTLNADGSGKVRLETQTSLRSELTASLSGWLGKDAVIYPPTSENEAQKIFPGKDFKLTVNQSKADSGEVTSVIEAEFTNINALLASPYGQQHQLSVQVVDGSLVVKAVTGMEAAARLAEIKDPSGLGMPMPGLADQQKKSGEMRAEFQVTLPNEIAKANGRQNGKTATWLVTRAECKDAEDFARKLAEVAEVSCPATGVTMSPSSPVRMGRLPFAELADGASGAGGASVDTNRIVAAAKFVPYGLAITRSLDLSGSDNNLANSAQLVGAILIPTELAPAKWGETKLEEAVDAKGNDLKRGMDTGSRSSFRHYSSMDYADSEPDEAAGTNQIQSHVIQLDFQPPDWKVGEIARIKGSVSLQYYGGTEVVKLTNAIPSQWLADAAKVLRGGHSFDSAEKTLSSGRLASLGLVLSVQMSMTQTGLTMLMLRVGGNQAELTGAQVYDSAGKPWPTFLYQRNFDGNDTSMCQILVAGQPQPPLSLALRVNGGGTTAEVPFSLEHVSLAQ